jgi:putative transposase
MGTTYHCIHIHYVFSTKNRAPLITGDLSDRLPAYVGGILHKCGVTPLCVGRTSDHIHVLASLPTTIAVGKVVQLAKANSSKWIHDTFPDKKSLAWQDGYGAFSVSVSHVPETVAYIENQREHHQTRTFREEYLAFLKKHKVEYDERYVWG